MKPRERNNKYLLHDDASTVRGVRPPLSRQGRHLLLSLLPTRFLALFLDLLGEVKLHKVHHGYVQVIGVRIEYRVWLSTNGAVDHIFALRFDQASYTENMFAIESDRFPGHR